MTLKAQAEVGTIQSMGPVALKLLASGFKTSALRTNDVLRTREWISLDKVVTEVARQQLVGVGDLLTAGMTHPIQDALGVTSVEWEKMSDMGAAEVNMSGVAEDKNERLQFDLDRIPLPIVHKGFNINIRALHASRNGNTPLDTTQARMAARIVSEKNEDILFNGGLDLGTNGKVYGYTNAPNAITDTLNQDWGLSATTGAQRLAEILEIINNMRAKNFNGPYMFYVPQAWYTLMGDDYKANGDRSILERLKAIEGVKDIKPSQNLTTKLVAIHWSQEVVDMIDGMQPTVLNWESHGGMILNFKVMSILVPRVKSDYNGSQGIAVYTKP